MKGMSESGVIEQSVRNITRGEFLRPSVNKKGRLHCEGKYESSEGLDKE